MAVQFTSPPPARPEAVMAPEDPRPPWPGWTALAALGTALVGAAVMGAVALAVMAAAGVNVDHADKGGVAIALTYVQDAVFIGTVLVFARLGVRRARRTDLGIRVPRVGPTLTWVGAAIVLYIGFSLLFSIIVNPGHDKLFDQLGIRHDQTAAVAALAVLICVIAPIAEELLFRGFMFAALLRWGGPWPAAIVVGVLFGAIHAFGTPAILLIQLAFLGFLFSVVRWKTGSVLPTMTLHAINNSLAFASLQGWDWQTAPLAVGATAAVLGVMVPIARSGWRARRALA